VVVERVSLRVWPAAAPRTFRFAAIASEKDLPFVARWIASPKDMATDYDTDKKRGVSSWMERLRSWLWRRSAAAT
jgi:hypothetical protein